MRKSRATGVPGDADGLAAAIESLVRLSSHADCAGVRTGLAGHMPSARAAKQIVGGCPEGRLEGNGTSGRRPAGGSAGPAGEEARDLMGGMSFKGIAAYVVAGQGRLGPAVAQQALDVAQRAALIEPHRTDGAARRIRADRAGNAGNAGGVGD